MKWYKHDSDASQDAKIRKLILRHGAEGYAVYFHCLELIAGDVSESNITFELEHDSEIIADNLKIKSRQDISAVDIVNNIMKYIIELELFQESNGKVFCFKMARRIDKSMVKNDLIKNIASKYESSVKIPDNSGKLLLEEKRRDKKEKKEEQIREEETESKEIIDYLNTKADRSFSYCESNIKHITARINDGHTKEQCLKVIDVKCSEWLNTDFDKYLRPETLFKPGKFENYLNQKQIIKQTELSNEEIAEKLWGKKDE